jgi:modulator of FtsH protease
VFLGGAFGFMFAIEKTKNSAAGVPVLLAFTFFMGLMLSRLVGDGAGLQERRQLVMTGLRRHGGVFFGMASLASVIKRDLSGMGKFLFIGAIMVLVAASQRLHPVERADDGAVGAGDRHLLGLHAVRPQARASTAARPTTSPPRWRVYLDIYNVFQSLLALLGIFGGERD